MSDSGRNDDFLLNQSGQYGPAQPYVNLDDGDTPGYYVDASGQLVPFSEYTYPQGAVPPQAPGAPAFGAPSSYDIYGNPAPYSPQDYQAPAYPGAYTAPPAYPDYGYAPPQPDPYAYTPQPGAGQTYGADPYAPPATQQAYPPAAAPNPFEQAYAGYQPHPDPWTAPWQPQQPPQEGGAVSGEFAQKFAEAAQPQNQPPDSGAAAQVTNKGLTGFDQLAAALESKMASKTRRQNSSWPPPKKGKTEAKEKTEAPKDVFDDSAVSLEAGETRPVKEKERMAEDEVSRIAAELSQAVLVKSHSRAFNDNNLMKEGSQRCIEVEDLSSDYYISEGGLRPYPMYRGVSFGLNAGTCCVLVSDVALSTYVLARAIAENADAGFDDLVRVADTPDGNPGKVFYIGGDSMLPPDMSCEEFLMYTMAARRRTDDEDYEKLSILLSQMGMSNVQENLLSALSYNVRILVLALAAALSPEISCVVVNDPDFQVEAEEEMMARRVFAYIGSHGKCSILACCSPFMMAAVANRVAVLTKGQLVFFGEYKNFLDDYCLGVMSFTVDNAEAFSAELERIHPEISVLCKDRLVYLMRRRGYPEVRLEALIRDIITLGADYNTIVMDEKSFPVACKEVLGN